MAQALRCLSRQRALCWSAPARLWATQTGCHAPCRYECPQLAMSGVAGSGVCCCLRCGVGHRVPTAVRRPRWGLTSTQMT